MDYTKLVEQLTANSTWRGIILIVTAIGVVLADTVENMSAILAAGLTLVGTINVVRTK